MLSIRPYEPKTHYPLLASWWNGHAWPIVPEAFLPSIGRVGYFSESPIVAGFLYKTDSKIAWIEWIVADPDSSWLERDLVIPKLIESLSQEAFSLGFSAIFTSTSHSSLISRFQDQEFLETDRNLTHLIRRAS